MSDPIKETDDLLQGITECQGARNRIASLTWRLVNYTAENSALDWRRKLMAARAKILLCFRYCGSVVFRSLFILFYAGE